MTAPRRPTSVAGMQAALSAFATEAGARRGFAFQPRTGDVIISTYPKCGTTWVQQIVHGLRTRGSMDFGEITLAVPWIELAHDMGLDPDPELVNIVLRQSSIDFMSARAAQFDDHPLREMRNTACGLPPGGGSGKVREGSRTNRLRGLPQELAAELDTVWREEIENVLGFSSYAALREALRVRDRRRES